MRYFQDIIDPSLCLVGGQIRRKNRPRALSWRADKTYDNLIRVENEQAAAELLEMTEQMGNRSV